jgi:hypothetical protein
MRGRCMTRKRSVGVRCPPPRSAARSGHAAIWAGGGMLVWAGFGGQRYESDGAIYFPE